MADERTNSPRHRTIHQVAFQLAHDMRLQIAPRMGEVGAGMPTQQMRALRLIWSRPDVTLVDISKTIKRDKAQVTRLVDELVAAGMVARLPNPKDGRSKVLCPTEKAEELFRRVAAIEAQFSDRLTKGIASDELELFFDVADRLSKNLSDIEASARD